MLKNHTAALLILTASAFVTGCNQTGSTFGNSAPAPGPPPLAVAPAPPASVQPNPAAPYVLSAQSAGPYIDFTIHNMGPTDLVVQKENICSYLRGKSRSHALH